MNMSVSSTPAKAATGLQCECLNVLELFDILDLPFLFFLHAHKQLRCNNSSCKIC